MEEQNVLSTITIVCQDCGKEFPVHPAEQKFYAKKGFELPKRCPECRKSKKEDVTEITCVDCGVKFFIDGYEKEYFERKGYPLPKRCRSCRDIKRKWNEEMLNEQANYAKEPVLQEGRDMSE